MGRMPIAMIWIGLFAPAAARADVPIDTRSAETEWNAPGFSNDGFFSPSTLGELSDTAVQVFGLRYSITLPRLNGGITPDWYQFTIAAPTAIGVTLNTWGTSYDDGGSNSGYPIVGLFNAQAAIDGFPLQESSTQNSGSLRYERLQSGTLAPGTYALAVSGFHGDDSGYYYNGGASYNWPYELTIQAGGSPPAPDTSATEKEWSGPGFSNDNFSTASNLGVLGPRTREMHGLRYNAGSHQRLAGGISPDWYKFTIESPMVLEVALNTWGSGYDDGGSASGRPIVGLFDAQGAIDGFPLLESSTLISDDDQYERMQTGTLAPGTYALAVSGFHGDNNNYYYDGGASYNWPYQLSLELTAPPFLPGDYNDNHVVDAADYTVWRDNLDSMATLPNDETPGWVMMDDYDVWKMHFGESADSGSGATVECRRS